MVDGKMPTGEMNKAITTVAEDSGGGSIQTQSEDGGDLGVQSTGETAQQGMEAAKQVQNLGFAEFTASLINGTFDAIVGATIKQMEAYAKLVADLEKGLTLFQAENISDAQIGQYLAERYPDGKGGTCIRPGYEFPGVKADPETGASKQDPSDQFNDVVEALSEETKKLDTPLQITRESLGITQSATKFSPEQVNKIRASIGLVLAKTMLDHLKQMARDGMARIVVTDGEISSKLTFHISTTTLQERQQEQYNQNLNRTQVGVGGNGLWWKAKASTDNTNLNVSSMNEKSFDSTLMDAQMIGRVKIRFKTESFPPYIPPTSSTDASTSSQGN